MDIKLANYRAEKKKKSLAEKDRGGFFSFFKFRGRGDVATAGYSRIANETMVGPEIIASESGSKIESQSEDGDGEEEDEEEAFSDPADEPVPRASIVRWLLYLALWSVLFLIFLELQFGAVYFAVSLLVGMWLNTRTRKKKRGEVSAYSVFNKDCRSIQGTLEAEDLQRQFLFGGIGIR